MTPSGYDRSWVQSGHALPYFSVCGLFRSPFLGSECANPLNKLDPLLGGHSTAVKNNYEVAPSPRCSRNKPSF